MIYITEGLEINGKSVSFIHLRDLFEFINLGGCDNQIIIQDVCLESGCILKVLPIYIDEKDIQILRDKTKWTKIKPFLGPKVIIKINVAEIYFKDFKDLFLNTETKIKAENVTLNLSHREYEAHRISLSRINDMSFHFMTGLQGLWPIFWLIFAGVNFIFFLIFAGLSGRRRIIVIDS